MDAVRGKTETEVSDSHAQERWPGICRVNNFIRLKRSQIGLTDLTAGSPQS